MLKSESNENFLNLIEQVSDNEAQTLQGGAPAAPAPYGGGYGHGYGIKAPKGLVKNGKFDKIQKFAGKQNGKKKGFVPVFDGGGYGSGYGSGGWW